MSLSSCQFLLTGLPVDRITRSGSNGGWSAALRFAPTQRPRKKATAPTAASLSALRSAMGSHEEAAPAGGPRIVGPAKASAFSAPPTVSAPPTLVQPSTSAAPTASSSTATTPAASAVTSTKPVGRTILPPSMTLHEADVNGFRGTAAGKKAMRNNKKRGNHKSNNKREDPSLSFHPSVVYEVGKPCDYVSALAHLATPLRLVAPACWLHQLSWTDLSHHMSTGSVQSVRGPAAHPAAHGARRGAQAGQGQRRLELLLRRRVAERPRRPE